MGTINPLGNDVPTYFSNLDAGVSGASMIDRFDASLFKTKFACQVLGFDPQDYGMDRKEARKTDRFAHFAIIAADQAISDSRLDFDNLDRNRAGVIIGTGVGGLETLTQEILDYVPGEEPRFSPLLAPKLISNIASGHVAIKYGIHGPNFSVSSACASAAHAFITAALLIRAGEADVMITGASEAAVTIPGIGGFNALHALSVNNDEYLSASRPFDRTRDGFVLGEGAGVLVMEEYEHAKRRGATIYAEVAGYGLTADGYHVTAPDPEGAYAALSMETALRSAGIEPSGVDYLNAHGTSTKQGDVAELNAIKRVFGDAAYGINISSTKSMTGHLLGSAGAIEVLACLHAIRDGIIPPTINFKEEDPEIDYRLNLTLNEAQQRKVNVALCNNFGFGGQNATLVLKAV